MHVAKLVIQRLKERGLVITTVESCTGGGLANALTNVPGASEVLRDAFVTYSNEAKIALGVPPEVIEAHTVYSQQCAVAMADAGIERSVGANFAVGVTGSLDRPDPANPGSSRPGEVHVALTYTSGRFSQSTVYTVSLEKGMSRRESKRVVILAILGWILDRLEA